tara:strand:+ start:1677 stop:2732 length:1056 start_codon:yes stop_codon:yes gene_type:complete
MSSLNNLFGQFSNEYSDLFGGNRDYLTSYNTQQGGQTQQGQRNQETQQFQYPPAGQSQFGQQQAPTPGTTGYGVNPFETLTMGGSGPGMNQQLYASMEIPSAPMSDMVAAGFLSDYQNLVEAEQFNRQRGDAEIARMRDVLAQVPEQIQGTAARTAADVREAGVRAREDIVTDVDEAIAEYDKTQQMEMSSAAAGIAANALNTRRQIESNPNLTDQQRFAAMEEAKFRNATQRQQAMAPMVTQFEQSMMQARLQGAGAKAQGYGFEAQAGQAAAQMENMAAVQASQYLMSGQQQMYDMVKNNPYQPVALADTLAAIYAMKMREPGPFQQVQMPTQDFFRRSMSGQLPFAQG